MTKTYASVNKLTTKLLESYPDAKFINVFITKDSINKNTFGKLNAEVLSISVEDDKKLMLKYEKIVEIFGGEVIISYNPPKNVVKSKLQVISINTEKSEFKGNSYYPSKVLEVSSSELLNKLTDFRDKYKEKYSVVSISENDYDYI